MKRLFLAIALLLPCVSHAQPRAALMSPDEQSVRKFVEDFATAISSNDVAALDRLTAPDYTFVNQTGVIQNKAVRFAPMKTGELRYTRVTYDQVQVHLFGNTAIVATRVKTMAKDKGKNAGGLFRSTLTLVRGTAGWRLVASQVTPISP